MTFKDLGIIDPILKALDAEGYTHPTPIQAQAIPILLKRKDLLGCAQTGTGKTAAFAIPIIQHIYLDRFKNGRDQKIKALIVTPTRELAIQIDESFSNYGKFAGIRNTVIFGGVKQGKQVTALRKGVDVLVATPGRLLDLIDQRIITLKHIEYIIMDEADHMLDMGFIHSIRKIVALLPEKRQSLFFSATMPPEIVKLSGKILGNPERITIKPEQATAEKVEQSLYHVSKKSKIKLLTHLLQTEEYDSALVFSRTKHGANKIVKLLGREDIVAEAIHGNKSQTARQKALNNFKNGDTTVLIATDIAARGIDVSQLSLVINYDLPSVPETYVHRIGRTGRAKASGHAVSFCEPDERKYLRDIEKIIKQRIPVVTNHPFLNERDEDKTETPKSHQPRRQHKKPRPNQNSSENKPKKSGGKGYWQKRKAAAKRRNQGN